MELEMVSMARVENLNSASAFWGCFRFGFRTRDADKIYATSNCVFHFSSLSKI